MVTIDFSVEDMLKSIPKRNFSTEEEPIFFEKDIYKYIVDTLNAAGLDAEIRYQDTDHSIIVMGEMAYISVMIETSEQALTDTLEHLADELNSSESLESYLSYKNGKYSITIEKRQPATGKTKGCEN